MFVLLTIPLLCQVTLDDQKLKAVDFRILWSSSANISKYKSYFSSPELIEFPTKVPGQNAYAYFYPPTNPIYQASQDEKPPLLLKSHGMYIVFVHCGKTFMVDKRRMHPIIYLMICLFRATHL